MRRQPDTHVRSFESASHERPLSGSRTSDTPRQGLQGKTRLELGEHQGSKREAVPPRLPSGWAAGLDLDRLRGVFREPHGTTARGWNNAEVGLSELGTLPPFSLPEGLDHLYQGGPIRMLHLDPAASFDRLHGSAMRLCHTKMTALEIWF